MTITGPTAEWEAWERRNAALWAELDGLGRDAFVARMEELTAELPDGHPVALFERAASCDSVGYTDRAVPLYREALKGYLPGERRRRAVIQLASSLRASGHPEESVRLLEEERERTSDHLDDALAAVLALGLTALGREREAVSVAVRALAPHLPRYQRSMANYARLLVEPDEG
ncbi:tetratricopeptide repeat protein [Streptomyces sp. NPDC060194]|uniref:tetratricopeptide repeat protein n=1 Tax=Streptomyces sp. NPDC060194 TaxID=3347069 RepID=UPI003669EEE6